MNTFNDKQLEFYNIMLKKINNHEPGMVLLDADAGKGKTYVASRLPGAYFLAPTHKAKDVMNNFLKGAAYCETIHKFLGWTMTYKSDGTRAPIYKKSNEEILGTWVKCCTEPTCEKCQGNKGYYDDFESSVIIVDECSMITEKQFTILQRLSRDILILFLGDHAQLPPVEEQESIVFSSNLETYTFDVNERLIKEKSITSAIITKYRNDVIENRSSDRIYNAENYPYTNVFRVIKNITDDFNNDIDSVFLAYRNVEVDKMNILIRKNIYPDREYKDYYIGETLIFSGYYDNNNDLCRKKYFSSTLVPIIEIDYDCQIELSFDVAGIEKCTKIRFIKIYDGFTYFHIPKDKKNKDRFNRYTAKLKKLIRTVGGNNELWKKYYSFTTLYNTDLKHKYAMTVHKSQGSGYHNVYVNENDIRKACYNNTGLGRKACYTAVSRCKNNVYII